MIVKLVMRSTLQISAALTAKKTCAKLQLTLILATKQVATIKLFPFEELASVSLICQKHSDKFRFFEDGCGNVIRRVEQFGEAAFKYRQEVEDLIEVTKNIEDKMINVFSELTNDQGEGTAEIQRFFEKVCK